MKKLLPLFLAVLWMCVSWGIIAAQDPEPKVPLIEYDYDELNVAGVTPMTGNFFSPLWGNATSDMDVRMLLHGYNIVRWETEAGMFQIDDTVVSGMVVTEDPAGNRTYTVALYNDLYYSDGSRVTARDYAFSMLLSMSHEAEAIGGHVRRPVYLKGYEEYINGKVPYLAGVRILADDQFSITVKGEYLPFFYELGLLDCIPCPISVIAPGVQVADDGNGVYLKNITPGPAVFTADLLRETILDPETGYLTHPAVTSGPYRLVSYENGRAVFEINEKFKGDSHGKIPSIPRLTYQSLSGEKLISALADGSVSLLNKITSADLVREGLAAVGQNAQLSVTNYPRTGLSFISFNTEKPAVSEKEVRQAIAFQMDKDEFVRNTVGTNGLRADGYYGMGQWMYQLLSGAIDYPIDEPAEGDTGAQADYNRELEEWESLSLKAIPVYEQNTEKAEELLNTAGWNLNAEGAPFQNGTDTLRYKQIENELVPLSLTLVFPNGSSIAHALYDLADVLGEIGIELSVTSMELSELLRQYYGTAEREYDMLFLASNFDALFDPSANFVENEAGEHVWVENGLADEELYNYTVDMRKTEAGDLLDYCRHWLEFQKRFADLLPMIPLYSNVYYDFYPRVLHDYNISSNLSWAQAVIPAFMSDVEEAEKTVEEDSEEIYLLD